jgi:alkylation response protein AidB-like acyl-CoA dehydrogenase
MDFSFSEEQEMLRKTARDFLAENCPKSFAKEMEKDEKGYSSEMWRKMAELGWMGLILPEEYGGVGGNFLDLVILVEEMGAALLPGPFIPTVVYSSLPLLHFGTEEQRREFLPKIASGELIMTLALTEPNATKYDEAEIEVRAGKEDDNWIVNGTKLFVPDAHIAHWLICAARAPEGVTLFLVDARSPEINCTLLKTIAEDKQCEVSFHKVKVPLRNILGEPGKGWQIIEKVKEWGALAQCALISGSIQRVLDMSVAYAKERVQFDRPIGSFQAIQHKSADMMMNIDGVKFLTYQAAWKLSQEFQATVEISAAKAWASDAAWRVCLLGHTIHGGVGISLDHDMQLYFRKAKAMELTFGDGDFHREIVAKELGLF